ncbi:hypothetical protein MML48_1g18960 [Holotrichia oblita]|uniref:Uncharacterized protein n=1 Tax=Holotrichia oblita TaxID=644536 RepID=A0ACB9TS93_HOLOL|nr:hypothetical protein MML48_1g18960 [Holotrichia oblita]
MYEFISGSTTKQQNHADICKLRFNSSMFTKLNALNQYDQPPGLQIYNSDQRLFLEYNNSRTPLEEAKEYLALHPEFATQHLLVTPPVDTTYKTKTEAMDVKHKTEVPNYRHKTTQAIDDEYLTSRNRNMQNPKKNLADLTKNGIYEYRNVRNAKDRLLHDLNAIPDDILKDTYLKTREQQLRRSRFEQRDLFSHKDRNKENVDVEKVLEEEMKGAVNASENLWKLESEKELDDRDNHYNSHYKRQATINITGVPKLTSVGALAQAPDSSGSTIDLIFLTYWLPPIKGAQLVLERDVQCISDKLKKALASKEKIISYQKSTLEELFRKECIEEQFRQNRKTDEDQDIRDQSFPYYNQVARLSLGQMTVYRVRIECKCHSPRKGERCAKFLDMNKQGWPSYLGSKGDGIFRVKG